MDSGAMRTLVLVFGGLSMVVCVSMALLQHDFKRLLAYHSISQIGYVLTAIGLSTALGVAGGLYHALNHSLFKGLLFLCAGCVLYRTGKTDLDSLGGLSRKMPHTCLLFLVAAASISGLPPFNGFASKWMIYQAIYQAAVESGNPAYLLALVCALIVSVMTLASFVKVAQSVFFGPLPLALHDVREAPLSMRIPMAILAVLCVVTGLFPDLVSRFLLVPATSSVYNVGGYIDAMMGAGYAASMGTRLPETELSLHLPGYWSPVSWLLLFVMLLAAGCIVALFARGESREASRSGGKRDVFFGGEKSVYSKVGGGDLFYGMRVNLSGYFKRLSAWHTGVVNDYALYASCALAVVIVYVLLFMGR